MNIQQFLENETRTITQYTYFVDHDSEDQLQKVIEEHNSRIINKILDEVQILVLKHPNTYEGEEELVFRTTLKEISTIIDQLKLK